MKTMIFNLPTDLVEEILSRVSVKCIGAVQTTCKNWNVLSKDRRFANKHIDKASVAPIREKDFLVITGDCKHSFIRVNLYKFDDENFDVSLTPRSILIRGNIKLAFSPVVSLSQVFYCNGLLLCLWISIKHSLLILNPYWGTRRWIKSPTYREYERFAFGHEKSCGSYKILMLSTDNHDMHMDINIDIYDLSSDSWSSLDTTFETNVIEYRRPGLSLKGNTYWYARDKESFDGFLRCFDFTKERFGPRLPLPPSPLFHSWYVLNVSLSLVKDEKLAVLLDPCDNFVIDIWVTDKIEPTRCCGATCSKLKRCK